MKIVRQPATETVKIVRRPPPIDSPAPVDWPFRPGYPHDAHRLQYHLLNVRGVQHTFLWDPAKEHWTCGLRNWSPADMSTVAKYIGVCYPTYRVPMTPTDEQRMAARYRR